MHVLILSIIQTVFSGVATFLGIMIGLMALSRWYFAAPVPVRRRY